MENKYKDEKIIYEPEMRTVIRNQGNYPKEKDDKMEELNRSLGTRYGKDTLSTTAFKIINRNYWHTFTSYATVLLGRPRGKLYIHELIEYSNRYNFNMVIHIYNQNYYIAISIMRLVPICHRKFLKSVRYINAKNISQMSYKDNESTLLLEIRSSYGLLTVNAH